MFISDHEDKILPAGRGYGKANKQEDYIQAFSAFIRSHSNDIPALMTVLTRPRELTRKQLRELVLELDKAGFTETNLATAWREMTNQDIAARIVGYIRQPPSAMRSCPTTSASIMRCKSCWHHTTGPGRSAIG